MDVGIVRGGGLFFRERVVDVEEDDAESLLEVLLGPKNISSALFLDPGLCSRTGVASIAETIPGN